MNEGEEKEVSHEVQVEDDMLAAQNAVDVNYMRVIETWKCGDCGYEEKDTEFITKTTSEKNGDSTVHTQTSYCPKCNSENVVKPEGIAVKQTVTTTASEEKKEEPTTPLPSPETEAEFLGDEENKKNCLDLAVQIGEFMGNKWFTVEMFQRKTALNRLEAIQRLQLSKMFGHVKMRMGVWEDGKEKNGKPLFKVAIAKEAKLKAIDEVIEYHRKQIEYFELQKKTIL